MITQITPICFAISNVFSNQYLLCCGGSWILVDAGLHAFRKSLIDQVLELIPPSESLSAILITHSDADHCGGASYIREATGAIILADEIEALAMRKGQVSRKLTPGWYEKPFYFASSFLFSFAPLQVDAVLKQGLKIKEVPGLMVIHTPGHTPGHISCFWENEKILFAGDSIRKDSHGKPAPSSGANTWNKSRALRSFSRQMDLHPQVIACGHAMLDFREKV